MYNYGVDMPNCVRRVPGARRLDVPLLDPVALGGLRGRRRQRRAVAGERQRLQVPRGAAVRRARRAALVARVGLPTRTVTDHARITLGRQPLYTYTIIEHRPILNQC